MKTLLLTILLTVFAQLAFSQPVYQQYFDGADTSASNSIFIQLDTSSSNVWQIGPPQKTIFNSPYSPANVLITDTINTYPVNASSSVTFYTATQPFGWGILALQWTQKLDMDADHDGGIIEYSLDHGATWNNVFNNPYVYNFYGFNTANQDTLVTGEYAFSGTDTTWKDIWLCFQNPFMMQVDTAYFRFTLRSDSIDNQREGWMIDNMMTHVTMIHTVKDDDKTDDISIYPSLTNGIINISGEKLQEYHIIESIDLIDQQGRIVKHYGTAPTKFWIDISDQKSGAYFLRITTNFKTKTFPIILNRTQ